MTGAELQQLQQRVSSITESRSRMEGAMNQLRERWKTQYGTEDSTEIQAMVNTLSNEVSELNKEIEAAAAEAKLLLAEMEGVV